MCGITGFINFAAVSEKQASRTLGQMCDALTHRGPDGDGQELFADGRVGLSQRRLAIIDLSPTGAQPMTSRSGRYTVVFNGEIYDFSTWRAELTQSGHVFRGTSDTEVLLAAIEQWGVSGALERLNGMLAFALFDHEERRVYLARDRLGKKPLYVGLANGTIAFGSELKALREHPAFSKVKLNRSAVALYAQYGYVPASHCIYEGIAKFPAGTWVSIGIDRAPSDISEVLGETRPFWKAVDAALSGHSNPFPSERAALDAIDAELMRAVQNRMVADVDVGSFLSGGIDSSLVTAMMQELSNERVHSYTIRFADADMDEARYAADIARHLGTKHTELTATPHLALDLFEQIATTFDEPLADPSVVPTLVLSKLTRSNVTVALSGDGGDELFGGYKRYWQMMRFERLARRLPGFVAGWINSAPLPFLDAALSVSAPFLPRTYREELSADRLKKLAVILQGADFRSRYDNFISLWPETGEVVRCCPTVGSPYGDFDVPGSFSPVETMMLLDTIAYLADDVLVKVDRASMAFGLEVRAPLLDYRVLEAAWRTPMALRLNGETGKIALRKLLERRLPKTLFDRPKKGFGIPINDWLRTDLRARADELLSHRKNEEIGVFDPIVVSKHWSEHLNGHRNWGAQLWSVIVFNLWFDRWMTDN